MTKEKYSLREKKHAKTKVALANAFIKRLETTRFSDISIKEVCQSVEVSEGTFYNYFPQKLDIISHFQYLHLLKMEWEISRQKNKEPLELIELAFDSVASTIKHPYVFYEIVSIFTSEHIKSKKVYLTPAEKFYAFPDYPEIKKIMFESLEDFFLKHLKEAKKNGQLDKNINLKNAGVMLMTILIGAPLAIEFQDFNKLSKIYKNQLTTFRKAHEKNKEE